MAPARQGAHNPANLRLPADVPPGRWRRCSTGLRIITIAPELPGALELIARLRDRGVVTSIGHSAADPRRGAGRVRRPARRHDTHLFNAMTGVDHRAPGARRGGAHRRSRLHRADRGRQPRPSIAVADHHAVQAGRSARAHQRCAVSWRGWATCGPSIGGLEVEVKDGRCTLVVGGSLAGAVVAVDTGGAQPGASRRFAARCGAVAASTNPARLVGAD